MATTPTTVAAPAVERALAYLADPNTDEAEGLRNGLWDLANQFAPYTVQEPGVEGSGNTLGEAYDARFDVALRDAAWEAVREHVVPIMARLHAQLLRDNPPPAYLLAVPGSEDLRADWAAVQATNE